MWISETEVWVGLSYMDKTRTYTNAQVVFTDEARASQWAMADPESRVTFLASFHPGPGK